MEIDNSFLNKTKFSFMKNRVANEVFGNVKDEMLKSEFSKAYSSHEESIKKELMEKYFRYDYRQMQLLLNDVEKQQLNAEVNETLDKMGIKDKEEKEEVTNDLIEEKASGKEANSKQTMKEKILLAAAKKRTKEFGRKIIDQKEGHIEDKTIAFSEEEAVKDIADAKVLEQIQRQYKKLTKKDLSQNKEIKKEEKKIENKTNYIQKGEEVRVTRDIRAREQIEKELQIEKRKLNEAIAKKSPKQEFYKQNVKKLEEKLVSLEKGQIDYNGEIKEQENIEDMAKKEKLERYDFTKDESALDGKKHKNISENSVADEVRKDDEKNQNAQEITQDNQRYLENKLIKDEEYDTVNDLEQIAEEDASFQGNINEIKIDGQKYERTYSNWQKNQNKIDKENQKQERKIENGYSTNMENEMKEQSKKIDDDRGNSDFINDLRSGVNSAEESAKNEENREEINKERDKDYIQEANQNRNDAERLRKKAKKGNNNTGYSN